MISLIYTEVINTDLQNEIHQQGESQESFAMVLFLGEVGGMNEKLLQSKT